MLHAALYALCCRLHALLKALGDARIIPTFVKKILTIVRNLSKIGSRWSSERPGALPGGSSERPGALPGGHVASGPISHR